MPLYFPPRVGQEAIALATAARHLDEPGGHEKLLELIQGLPCASVHMAALVLARMVGFQYDDEKLQDLALQAVGPDASNQICSL
jgi:hypothetical protein